MHPLLSGSIHLWIIQNLFSQVRSCSLGAFLSCCTASSSHHPLQRQRPSSLCLYSSSENNPEQGDGFTHRNINPYLRLPETCSYSTGWSLQPSSAIPALRGTSSPGSCWITTPHKEPLLKPAGSWCSSFSSRAPLSTSITHTTNQVEMSLLQLRSSSLTPHCCTAREQLPLNPPRFPIKATKSFHHLIAQGSSWTWLLCLLRSCFLLPKAVVLIKCNYMSPD